MAGVVAEEGDLRRHHGEDRREQYRPPGLAQQQQTGHRCRQRE
jgi:hypothetical protein